MSLPDVRVGQEWADCDWRQEGRVVRVVGVPSLDVPNPGEVGVTVEVVEARKVANGPEHACVVGKRRTIRLRRFKPGSTGYSLVRDADRV